MIQTFLTIDEAAEKLKDRGYTYEIIQALAAEGKVPWHVRDMVMVIPFPEAEQYLPPIVAEKPMDPPEIEKPKTAPKGTAKKSRA